MSMRLSRALILPLAICIWCSACSTVPSAAPQGPRVIVLGGERLSEEDLGEFVSWRCLDYVDGGRTLVEVGTFANAELAGVGFVLYDGGYSGDSTNYQRKGINRRWDWGPSGAEYAFVLKPDGTGLFYDFSLAVEGESIKANEVYECREA